MTDALRPYQQAPRAMQFFVGIPNPHNAQHVGRAFVSVNALMRRKSDFAANDWIMDSGAFSQITQHGRFVLSVGAYAAQIDRWSRCGNLLAAVAQGFMCEPFAFRATGATVVDHQRWTIERYVALRDAVQSVPVMPVLQGWIVAHYVSHVRQYGDLLAPGAWVGVGSVCKRNSSAGDVAAVLAAIKAERPDLRLHGFGLKITALGDARVRDALHSADSMAWSSAARRRGQGANNVRHAIAFSARVNAMPVQGALNV